MRYGPGKFENCGNHALVSQWVYMGGFDEEIGNSGELGWHARFSGTIKGRGPFHALVSEDNNGFVSVTWYHSEIKLNRAWDRVEEAYGGYDESL